MDWVIRFCRWLEKRQAEKHAPAPWVREVALLKVRLDKLELYTGLRRDPSPLEVPGSARIS